MRASRQTFLALAMATVAVGATVLAAIPVSAAELPKSTQAMLKELKLYPSILSGLDQELAVPQEWIDAAKQETTRQKRLAAMLHELTTGEYMAPKGSK